MTFFPGDFGVSEISNNGSNSGSDKVREPEEIIVFND